MATFTTLPTDDCGTHMKLKLWLTASIIIIFLCLYLLWYYSAEQSFHATFLICCSYIYIYIYIYSCWFQLHLDGIIALSSHFTQLFLSAVIIYIYSCWFQLHLDGIWWSVFISKSHYRFIGLFLLIDSYRNSFVFFLMSSQNRQTRFLASRLEKVNFEPINSKLSFFLDWG